MNAKEIEHVRTLMTATFLLQGMVLSAVGAEHYAQLRQLYSKVDDTCMALGFADPITRKYVPEDGQDDANETQEQH